MAKDEEKIRIQNVVASASFKQTFDLNAIFKAFLNVEYRPEVFPGVAFRLKSPKTCTLIFKSGKMVCTGARSVKQARRAIFKVARELRKGGIVIIDEKPEITITNIVASANLDRAIDLVVLCETEPPYPYRGRFGGNLMYEPEQFPAAIYRMKSPRVVFLIFSTGKLVCVGAQREEEVYEAVEKLAAILEERGVLIKEA